MVWCLNKLLWVFQVILFAKFGLFLIHVFALSCLAESSRVVLRSKGDSRQSLVSAL